MDFIFTAIQVVRQLSTPEGESVAGLAAGGHWDPDNSGTHLGPFGKWTSRRSQQINR